MGSAVERCCYSPNINDIDDGAEGNNADVASTRVSTTDSQNKNINANSTAASSDSSDDEEETGHLEDGQPFSFGRKISTKKGFDKTHCVKSGYLQIRRKTSLHQWKKRYFWLKGRVLFYGRDDKVDIFEEISLVNAKAAEEKENVRHVFTILSRPGNIELKADSRKDMESWIQSIDHAARQEFYDPNAQHTIISGQHTWYIMSHVKIVHCNICRELLSPRGLPIVHGLSCAVCKTKSHKGCAIRAPNNCKWSTFASVGEHVIEDTDGTLDIEHQWVEGNLSHNSHCAVCDKKCGSFSKLVDERCLWCKLKVHTACKSLLPRRCSKALSKYSVLSPVCIQSLDSSGLCSAVPCKGATTSPLLVFVNSKSGDNHGVKFLRRFKQLLNPAQVFDLMNGGPSPGLRLFQNLDQFRILICGGDGSISWVMSEMDKLNLHPKCQIGVLPLGTGNDLSRVLGWGAAIDNDSVIPDVIDELEQSQIKMLDRWSIRTFEWKQSSFLLPKEEPVPETITEEASPADAAKAESGDEVEVEPRVKVEESRPDTEQAELADCLHKIIHSSDHLTVLRYSRSLCSLVDKFLSRVFPNQKRSSSDEHDETTSLFTEQFNNVQAKLKLLMDSLDEIKDITEEPSTDKVVEEQPSPGNLPTEDGVKVFTPRDTIMSRARSFKKAVLDILKNTDDAINMTICPSLSDLPPTSHSIPDQHTNTPCLTPSSACPADSGSQQQDQGTTPDVTFSIDTPESTMTESNTPIIPTVTPEVILPAIPAALDATSSSISSGALLSSPRNISAVSLLGPAEQSGVGSGNAASSQPQPKPCPRVKNSLAHKTAGVGFITKVLMANADAICAPVVPTFDERSIQSRLEEKTAMNNYFGIGVDAKIVFQFHSQRDSHPEKFLSRFGNLWTMVQLGSKEIIAQTLRNFEKRITLECDGVPISLPKMQGIVVLNIPSYSGGTDFWGSHNRGSNEPFAEPSFDDKIMEVMAVFGSAHIGASRIFNFQYHRIAQCRSVKLTVLGTEPVPMQVDGEAWMQNPGCIVISHKNRAQMLVKDKVFRHTFQSWSTKPKLSTSSQPGDTQSAPSRESPDSSRVADSRMESIVQSTRHLIDCLSSLDISTMEMNEKVLAKCGEFSSLYEATQAGWQELTLCSTELCKEVQEFVDSYSMRQQASADAAKVERLREVLTQTQTEVDKYSSPNRRRKRHGPFAVIGRYFLSRRKRHSNSSSKSSSSATEIMVHSWSADEVAAWLAKIGLDEYAPGFIQHDIRGSELLMLQQNELKVLGITKVGHVKRFQAALKSLSLGKDSTTL